MVGRKGALQKKLESWTETRQEFKEE